MDKQALYGFTNYPFQELGDKLSQRAPRRNVKIVGYDQDKYVMVVVFDGKGKTIEQSIKRGYVYRHRRKSRMATSWCYSHKELCSLPKID